MRLLSKVSFPEKFNIAAPLMLKPVVSEFYASLLKDIARNLIAGEKTLLDSSEKFQFHRLGTSLKATWATGRGQPQV